MQGRLIIEAQDRVRPNELETAIEWCPKSRLPQLQAFIGEYWAAGHILSRDADLLSWQYRYPEQPHLLSVLIARRGERILGFLGIIRFSIDLAGSSRSAAWLATWFVLPSERDRSLGIQLLRAALQQGFQFVGCLGMNDTTSKILAAFRFTIHDSLPRWILPVSQPAWSRVVGGDPAPSAPANTDATGVQVVDWSGDSAAQWDKYWERFSEGCLSVRRDTSYLGWRYVNHPCFSYSLRLAKDAATGEVVGLAVYRIERIRDSEDCVLRIVEFCAEGLAGKALAQDIIHTAQESRAAFADFYCTSPVAVTPLQAAGFVAEDTFRVSVPSLFQPLDRRPRPLNAAFWMPGGNHPQLAAASLYLTRTDGDQDRPN